MEKKSKAEINEIVEKAMAEAHQENQQENQKVDESEVKEAIEVMGNFIRASHFFRSVKRAMRRGHVTSFGMIVSRRPFNNRANTSKRKGVHSRFVNQIKKRDYEAAKSEGNRQSV